MIKIFRKKMGGVDISNNITMHVINVKKAKERKKNYMQKAQKITRILYLLEFTHPEVMRSHHSQLIARPVKRSS